MPTDRKKKKQWGREKTGVRAEKLPVMTKVMEDKRAPDRKKGALTMEEKMGILEMYATENDTSLISQKFNRPVELIRKFIWRYQSTTKMAGMRLAAGAEQLADRIVEQANVDQALEVMDRLDILSKKRDKSAPVSSFSLIIGVPAPGSKEAKAMSEVVPIPSQKQIEGAIEAEVVKVVG